MTFISRAILFSALLCGGGSRVLGSESGRDPLPAGKPLVFGGRQWKLKISSADTQLLNELKSLPSLSWCFESLQGRGLVLSTRYHLTWEDSAPSLSLSASEVHAHPEDASILLCLNATLKENPPRHHMRSADELLFEYTIERRRG